jgi:hypothetical protein
MESSTRGKFLIAGSIIAFIGFILPGLYGVSYNPPANSATASINIGALQGFGGPFSSAGGGVYNGFGGPVDFHLTLFAILVWFGLGLYALKFDVDKGIALVNKAGKHSKKYQAFTAFAQGLIILQFIWAFRSGGTPSAITQKFIDDLGGGQAAIDASHYLSGLLGFGTLILFFGLLVGSVGWYSRRGCLVLTAFCVIFVVLLLFTKVTTGAW